VKPGIVNATFLLISAYFTVCRSDLDFEPSSARRNVLVARIAYIIDVTPVSRIFCHLELFRPETTLDGVPALRILKKL
jgi:hypothetical protein